MCGRYTLAKPLKTIVAHFKVRETRLEFKERYNIAPTQTVPAIVAGPTGPVLEILRWGLIPSWAKDESIGNRLINARSETVLEKPAFKSGFRQSRCLIPADGFIEWSGKARAKTPHLFALKNGGLFAFAGIRAEWQGAKNRLETFAILTTSPNPLVAVYHDRMPVILPEGDYARWLDSASPPEELVALLAPCPAEAMTERILGQRVNSPEHDDPACLEPPSSLFAE